MFESFDLETSKRMKEAFDADARAKGVNPYAHSISIPVPPSSDFVKDAAKASVDRLNKTIFNAITAA